LYGVLTILERPPPVIVGPFAGLPDAGAPGNPAAGVPLGVGMALSGGACGELAGVVEAAPPGPSLTTLSLFEQAIANATAARTTDVRNTLE